jgi:hypothetical protein
VRHLPLGGLLAGLAAGLLAASIAQGSPITPASDDEVVQRLPYRLDATERTQRQRLMRGAVPLAEALDTARSAIDRSRRHGDPRELGLAEAALATWWTQAAPPPAVRLLRATVHQCQHRFEVAMTDLDALIAPSVATPLPVAAQAELTRAAVLQVTGRLAEARTGCERLGSARYASLGPGVAVAAQACIAELRSLRGETQAAAHTLAALTALTQRSGSAGNDGGRWLALVRAELAERTGDEAAAASRYAEAVGPDADVYSRAAYADWLLDRRRHAEVLTLLATGDTDADALLLRRAIAQQRLNDVGAATSAAALQARFDAARERGDASHAREEARFLLDVRGDAVAALPFAQANWARQKEPADAVLLARVAVAAKHPEALAPLRALVQETGWTDVRLAQALRERPPKVQPKVQS